MTTLFGLSTPYPSSPSGRINYPTLDEPILSREELEKVLKRERSAHPDEGIQGHVTEIKVVETL